MTTYTERQRKSLANAFTKALNRLPDLVIDDDTDMYTYQSPYICDNITHSNIPEAAKDLAVELIAKRIQGAFSVERWLKDQSNSLRDEIQHDVLCNKGRKLQAYRKAWLQSLIKEFSN